MARVGNAIGTAVDTGLIVMQQLTYTWQPVATIRDRPITQMDRWCEGTQLVVLDAALWHVLSAVHRLHGRPLKGKQVEGECTLWQGIRRHSHNICVLSAADLPEPSLQEDNA